jgi:hypothetical protein
VPQAVLEAPHPDLLYMEGSAVVQVYPWYMDAEARKGDIPWSHPSSPPP